MMDKRCQQFTPEDIAENMLDVLGYSDNLYGKKILENSCGKGDILKIIVERYIQDGKRRKYSEQKIKYGLENDIYGAEIKKETFDKCINVLNNVAAKYSIKNVSWNIKNSDILKNPFKISFDYIIGNPPYISYKNLDVKTREFIKSNFNSCKKGKPDYCYAFIESSVDNLKAGGRMIYLIPCSIFKNVFAEELRKMIKEHIISVFDYPNIKIFKDAITSSSIMLLEKNSTNKNIDYTNVTTGNQILINKITLGKKWIFDNSEIQGGGILFEEMFNASMVIATQCNSVYVIDDQKRQELEIESDILRIAVSPRNKAYPQKEYIIFPYQFVKNKLKHYSEDEFKKRFPHTYDYLNNNREKLDARKADKSAKWFEYGRSQAIQHMNKPKLLVSIVATEKVSTYMLSRHEIPYAGIYITAKDGYDLKTARDIIQSQSFYEYIHKIGTSASGKSVRITAKDINSFRISDERIK